MHRFSASSRIRGFTLIELLTVIAIIAILTAIIFPVAGTVREQARSSDCLSKLHQLWVSANVYKQDEGGFPPVLLSYAEAQQGSATDRLPWDPTVGNETLIGAKDARNGYLYREIVKDVGNLQCPDSPNKDAGQVSPSDANFATRWPRVAVKAYYPDVQSANSGQPYYWPIGYQWIGVFLQNQGCRHDATIGGTEDCWYEVPSSDPLYLKPKYYYAIDAFDIGPAIDPVSGAQKLDSAGLPGYFRHYSTDWTGKIGLDDLPFQLKYANPPDDKTILAYCTWHATVAHSGTAPAISMAGTAKKLDIKRVLSAGPLLFAP